MSELLCGVNIYILHARPFRNTSLVLDCLSDRYGRIGIAARSARGPKSRFRGHCQLFRPLLVNIRSNRSLYNLVHMELQPSGLNLSGDSLLCGFYVNELMVKLLQSEEDNRSLFDLYEKTLVDLNNGINLSVTLRLFEKQLLSLLGYDLCWTHTADTGEAISAEGYYTFQLQTGFVESSDGGSQVYSGKSLLAMNHHSISLVDANHLKKLMRLRINFYLQGRKLVSRESFS